MTPTFAGPLLSDPLVGFDSIIFVATVPPALHMCDQYCANIAGSSDGLYLLSGLKSGTPKVTNLTANSVVAKGTLAGQKLAPGGYLSPDLSYDGKTILFAWSPGSGAKCYHIFKMNIDGSNLVQLTDGVANYDAPLQYSDKSHNDFDPCWLPNGRIVFISERRGGAGRCTSGRPFPTYTLYSLKDDGTDITPISYHETNEWHPSVNNSGMIVYTRWDYLDRDDCIAHQIWTCYPDGRDPRAPSGNYPNPLQTLAGAGTDGRYDRPSGEWNIRAIPNSAKYVATAGCLRQVASSRHSA
jgi:hypothetical protein